MLIHRGKAAIILILVSILFGHTPALGRTEFEIGSFRAGANVTVSADDVIGEELVVAGANVTAAGEMKSGLKAFGANVIIPGRVKGQLYAFGANVALSGAFHEQVTAAAANIVLSGNFERDIDVAAARITVTPDAKIMGNLTHAAGILDIQAGAQILGQVTQKRKREDEEQREQWVQTGKKAARAAGALLSAIATAALLVIGLIINALFPGQTAKIVALISEAPGVSIVTGLVFLVAVPVAVFIAFITVIGIPVAVIAAMIYGMALYISRIFIGLWIGRKIFGYFKKTAVDSFFWPLAAGVVMITLAGLIPLVGWLLKLVCLLIGLGALCTAAWRSVQARRQIGSTG